MNTNPITKRRVYFADSRCNRYVEFDKSRCAGEISELLGVRQCQSAKPANGHICGKHS